MLTLSHVWRTYQIGESTIPALRDVTLSVAEGDLIAIVGPSGSGTSTLLPILGPGR